MKQQVLLHYYFLICLYLGLISWDHLYIKLHIACNPFQYELGNVYPACKVWCICLVYRISLITLLPSAFKKIDTTLI